MIRFPNGIRLDKLHHAEANHERIVPSVQDGGLSRPSTRKNAVVPRPLPSIPSTTNAGPGTSTAGDNGNAGPSGVGIGDSGPCIASSARTAPSGACGSAATTSEYTQKVQGPVKKQQPDEMSHNGGGVTVGVCGNFLSDLRILPAPVADGFWFFHCLASATSCPARWTMLHSLRPLAQ